MAVAITLKLPEKLKARIALLTEACGQSPRASRVEASEERVVQSEAYTAFIARR